MIDYRGKTAVITGASSGIGRSLALALAKEGMNVVVAATNRERVDAVASEVRSLGVRATSVLCDVGPYTSAKAGVMALSVALRPEAAAHGIGISVLIPYAVRTDILLSERSRPAAYGGPSEPVVRLPTIRPGAPEPAPGPFMLEPDEVAAITVAGLKKNRPFIVTHKSMRPIAAEYFDRILGAYDI